jgi:hypothetical protein
MCFSAEADFVGAAVAGAIGVATLREPHETRELPLALLPLGFALHQLAEGIVWLDLEGGAPKDVGNVALYAYLIYAWALLPLLIPLAVLLVEPLGSRRRIMTWLLGLGTIAGAYLAWSLLTQTVTARVVGHAIDYGGAGSNADAVTVLYVIATCGAFLLSTHRRIVIFGVFNLGAVLVLVWVQAEALTSLWCAWAAILSLLIYLHFADRRRIAAVRTGASVVKDHSAGLLP